MIAISSKRKTQSGLQFMKLRIDWRSQQPWRKKPTIPAPTAPSTLNHDKSLMNSGKSLFTALCDFTFGTFVTTKLVKILYVVAIAAAALCALTTIVSGFAQGFLAGLGAVILGVIGFVVSVLLARVWLEMIIVIFRIAEDISTLAGSNRSSTSTLSGTDRRSPGTR